MNYAHHSGDNPMPIDETTNKRMVLVVDIPTAQAIERLAKRDRRSVSNYVRNVLQDHVKTQGEPDVVTEQPSSNKHIYTKVIADALAKLQAADEELKGDQ